MRENHGIFWTLPNKPQKLLPAALLVLFLCGIAFYFGGIYCSDKDSVVVQEPTHAKAGDCALAVPTKTIKFEECDISMSDFTPCTDPKRWGRYVRRRMAFIERHCPSPSERLQCLIPPPSGYKVPVRWPQSRDECWYRNVPYDYILTKKADQRWMEKKGEKFLFPGGGTMFSHGVDKYLDQMEELIPGMKTGTIRTALDTGCGVASWGGYLLERGILTMSLAPKDNHVAQVEFALERGIPAMIGILATQRLPYPSSAFDMAHCSRCLIPWTDSGGVLLLEVDRVLRPGGFWILSGPPINYQRYWRGWNTTKEKQKSDLDSLSDLLERMCYTVYAMQGDFAVWQKPSNNSCYENREEGTLPPLCDDTTDPDASWYIPMHPCIVKQQHTFNYLGVGETPKWPERLNSPPERANYFAGGSAGSFKMDTELWRKRLQYYKSVFPQLGTNSIRNVMDMNTRYGGFAASLINDPVWVMNVVSSYGVDSLGVIYDRGLIGTTHDWCEAFSTYPRTYDLLHLDGLFTEEGHRCEMKNVLLEMDRILRPTGHVLMRDNPYILNSTIPYADALHWNCHQFPSDNPLNEDGNLLICQKEFWQSA